MTRVVHCKREPFDVYIGRPSKWGNKYSHKSDTLASFRVATVEEAVAAYERDLDSNPEILAALSELQDKTLGCWCKPVHDCAGPVLCWCVTKHPCHGDPLARRANLKLP